MYTMHLTKPRNSVGKKEVAYVTLHGICSEIIIPQNKWVITVLTYLKPLSIPSLYELLCSFLGQNCLNCSKTAFLKRDCSSWYKIHASCNSQQSNNWLMLHVSNSQAEIRHKMTVLKHPINGPSSLQLYNVRPKTIILNSFSNSSFFGLQKIKKRFLVNLKYIVEHPKQKER